MKVRKGPGVMVLPVFLGYLVLTLFVVIITIKVPSLAVLTALFWGALLIIAGMYLQLNALLSIFIANIILIAAAGGIFNLTNLLVFYGFPAIIMGFLTFRENDYQKTRRWGAITLIGGVSLYLGALYWSGQGIELTRQINEMIIDAGTYYEVGGFTQIYEGMGLSQQEIQALMQKMVENLLYHLPAIFYVQGLLAVILMLWLAAFFTRNQHAIRLNKKPFAYELMSWKLAWLVILGLALALLGWNEHNYIFYIGTNILVVMAVISFYYGLASLVFRIKYEKGRGRTLIIVLMAILALFFPLSALGFLCILGILDSLLDLRKPYKGQEV